LENEFKRIIKSLIDERLETVRTGITSKNMRYIRLRKRSTELEERFIEALPEDLKKLFDVYEEVEATLGSIIEKSIYKKGLRDGIRLANIASKVLKL
jgi:hypothetical protein